LARARILNDPDELNALASLPVNKLDQVLNKGKI